MRLKSSDFENNGHIPSRFTCDGEDVSPQLSWEDVPDETESFAVSVTDPDASGGEFIHWLVYNIPKEVRSFEQASLPEGVKQVENDFRMRDYGGPCPPSGTHRYIFTVYALDSGQLEEVSKRTFFKTVESHA
ncbi:MAG: YbhB/YbcL family Raf kinase inhibitor-like protein, partial [Aigarchaeota archaeon]|nr:YbhB/YbcL family Raf kinase inhibitor-like protein [Aigarchaeota archaeon]